MPSRTEDFDSPSTLPPEELNPLLNALLAQNMGRWAEVYFTALPENRDQAVLDLLCQLREEASLNGDPSAPEATAPVPAVIPVSDGTNSSAEFVRCPQCGYENRSDHNFCGSCRAELRNPASAAAFFDALIPRASTGEPQQAEPPQTEASLSSGAGEQLSVEQLEADRQRFEHRKWQLDQPAPVRSLDPHSLDPQSMDPQSIDRQSIGRQSLDRQNNDRLNRVRTPVDHPRAARQNDVDLFRFASAARRPRSYRVYLASMLAILVLFLLYRAWSNGRAAGTSQTAPQVPPAVAGDTAAPSTTSAVSNSAASATGESRPIAPPSTMSTPNAEPASNSISNSKTDPRLKTVSHEASPTATAGTLASDAEGLPQWGNGAAELTLAKSYLNGTEGKERSSAEAAALLWKAVAKKNAEATELLSDLYLKGDGVAKSCDQARILLDAAARKGRKDAGERLSHLQAFGCQ